MPNLASIGRLITERYAQLRLILNLSPHLSRALTATRCCLAPRSLPQALLFLAVWIAPGEIVRAEESFPFKVPAQSASVSITRPFVGRLSVPPNSPYDRLGPEERETVRAEYTGLKDDDEPPYPKHGPGSLIAKIAYITQKGYQGALGDVIMTVQIDELGVPRSVAIYKTPDPGLARLVAAILMQGEYKPAKRDGVPCAMNYLFAFRATNAANGAP